MGRCCLPACPPGCFHSCLPACLTCLLSCWLTCLLACCLACLHPCFLACLRSLFFDFLLVPEVGKTTKKMRLKRGMRNLRKTFSNATSERADRYIKQYLPFAQDWGCIR